MGMSNTLLIAQTKIIEPMLFTNYPKYGITFLVGLGNTLLGCNKYVMEPKRFFLYNLKDVLHTH